MAETGRKEETSFDPPRRVGLHKFRKRSNSRANCEYFPPTLPGRRTKGVPALLYRRVHESTKECYQAQQLGGHHGDR